MGVGYLSRFFHLLSRGSIHPEGYIIIKGVIEEDGLLIHIAYQLAEVMHPQVFHVDAIDEHLPLLHIVVTGNEVEQGRLSAAALSHQCDGFPFGYDEVDVSQHPLLLVFERDMPELYLVFEAVECHGLLRVVDGHFGLQYLVHALHGGQTLRNVVAGLAELLERIDDGV